MSHPADPELPPARSRRAPWLAAAVLALVVAALVLALVRVDSVRANADAGSQYGPTAQQRAAVRAGAIEAANMLTFTRAHFARDYDRALHGMTGALAHDFGSARIRNKTLQTMRRGKVDLRGTVVQSAFESQSGGSVLIMVTVNGMQVSDAGNTSTPNPQRLELTMVQRDGRWLASNLTSVGIQ